MCSSFWKNAAASLPTPVQRRCAAEFAAAERFEAALDLVTELVCITMRVFGRCCSGAAGGLRKTARILDAVARNLAPRTEQMGQTPLRLRVTR
jgi:hypothetical protein